MQSLQGTRVAVTGAGGFIGSRLVEELTSRGASVLALGRKAGKLADRGIEEAVNFADVELTDRKSIRTALTEFAPQVLYHLACHRDGRESYVQVRKSLDQNQATLNTLDAFAHSGNARLFVYGDTTKVYGDTDEGYRSTLPVNPLSSYAIAKTADFFYCKLYSRMHGFRVASVRPTLIYGPHQAFNIVTYTVQSVLDRNRAIQIDGGDQTRDPLYIDDAVAAFIATIGKMETLDGHIIDISGANEVSVLRLVKMILAQLGSDMPVVSNMGKKRLTEMNRSYCDNTEAREILGWRPQTDLETGLDRTIAFMLSRQDTCVPGLAERLRACV